MNNQRAIEIMESLGVIEVSYKGSPVWLERVGKDNMAEVTYLESDRRIKVPLDNLNEGIDSPVHP